MLWEPVENGEDECDECDDDYIDLRCKFFLSFPHPLTYS